MALRKVQWPSYSPRSGFRFTAQLSASVAGGLQSDTSTESTDYNEGESFLADSKFIINTKTARTASQEVIILRCYVACDLSHVLFQLRSKANSPEAKQRTADQPEEEMEAENKTLQIKTIYEDSPPPAVLH